MNELDQMLAAVPWDKLEGSSGSTRELPVAVRKLISRKKKERSHALNYLFEMLWDQGTVYEPSVRAIGPLVYQLSQPDFQEPAELLTLLDQLAGGNGMFTAHQALSVFRDMHGPEVVAARVAEEADMLSRLQSEFRKHVEIFQAFSKHPDAAVRKVATRLLGRRIFGAGSIPPSEDR